MWLRLAMASPFFSGWTVWPPSERSGTMPESGGGHGAAEKAVAPRDGRRSDQHGARHPVGVGQSIEFKIDNGRTRFARRTLVLKVMRAPRIRSTLKCGEGEHAGVQPNSQVC